MSGEILFHFTKKEEKKTKPYCLKCFNNSIETSKVSHFFLVLKECQQVHTEAADTVCTIWGVRRGAGIQAFLYTEDQCRINTQFKEKS